MVVVVVLVVVIVAAVAAVVESGGRTGYVEMGDAQQKRDISWSKCRLFLPRFCLKLKYVGTTKIEFKRPRDT